MICLVRAVGDDDCGSVLGLRLPVEHGARMLWRVTKRVVAGMMLEQNTQAIDNV